MQRACRLGWPLLMPLALSTATGLLFGLMPALRLAHSADRGGTADPRGVRIRQLLIAGVTATTLMLVFSASMLLTSFQRLTASPRTANDSASTSSG